MTCRVHSIMMVACALTVLTACNGTKNPFARNTQADLNAPGNFAPYPGGQAGIESSVLPEPIRGQQSQEIAELHPVYYTFDSASLLEPAMAQLDDNANWMLANPNVTIQIEGHCDSRGTADYNYSLGQKRADAARDYLISRGVPSHRLHTISYGADRPADNGNDDMAWARNRRVSFSGF